MKKQIGAFEARRNFGQVLEEAFYKKDAFIVSRSGREMAAIVSIDDYRKWQKLSKQMAMRMIQEVWERNEDVPIEALEADVDHAIDRIQAENEGSSLNPTP